MGKCFQETKKSTFYRTEPDLDLVTPRCDQKLISSPIFNYMFRIASCMLYQNSLVNAYGEN